MRDSFFEELEEVAESDPSVIFLTGDLGFSAVEKFAERHPDKFLNLGITEQSIASVAAGLASEGHRVFCYSIGNFLPFRAAEQIRNDIAYNNLDVCIVSVGGGFTYGSLGYSHHAIQDFALMRSLPNLSILTPANRFEVKSAVREFCRSGGPAYLRLGKGLDGTWGKNGTLDISSGLVSYDVQGRDQLALGSGLGLDYATEILNLRGMKTDLGNMLLWGAKSQSNLLKLVSSYSTIYAIEEHLYRGGFSSWLLEEVQQIDISERPDIIPMTISPDAIGAVGDRDFLMREFFG